MFLSGDDVYSVVYGCQSVSGQYSADGSGPRGLGKCLGQIRETQPGWGCAKGEEER